MIKLIVHKNGSFSFKENGSLVMLNGNTSWKSYDQFFLDYSSEKGKKPLFYQLDRAYEKGFKKELEVA